MDDVREKPLEHGSSLSELLRLSGSLTLNLSLDQQLQAIARAISTHLGYGCVMVSIYDQHTQRMRSEAAVGVPPEVLARLQSHSITIEELDHDLAAAQRISSSYFLPAGTSPINPTADDAPPWAYYPAISQQPHPDAWLRGDDLLVPLRHADGALIGMLSVDAPVSGRRPSLEQVQMLEIFAHQAAAAIVNSRLYEQARAQADQLQMLTDIGSVLASTLAVPQLYAAIFAQLRRILPLDAGFLVLFDEREQLCRTVYWVDQGEEWTGVREWPLDDGPTSHVIRTQEPYIPENKEGPFARGHMFGDTRRLSNAAIYMPLLLGARIVGVLSVQSYTYAAYSDFDLHVLETVSSQAAVALTNAQLVKEIQQSLESLQLAQEQLVRQEKLAAMGQLAAGVAHDLNNPLSTVVGFAELLLAQALPPPIRHDVELIHQAAARSARIVQNLLTFARPAVDARQRINLNDVIVLVLDLQRSQLHVASVALDVQLAPDLPPVEADVFQLQQVLVNLLTNAHQALRDWHGERRIQVLTRAEEGQVLLLVSDTGPGIALEVLPRIFDPFFTTKAVGEGTGLGLSTAYGIVTAHGGQLTATSVPGEGATFSVALPAVLAPPTAAEATAPEPSAPATTRHILVVDDEPLVARLVERILRRGGYTAQTANNGAAALELLQRHHFDAVVSDLRMPGVDGPQLYRLLQEQHPELCSRVLFTTGDSVSPESRTFLENTTRPFVSKPFTIETLLDAVGQLFDDR